MAHMSPDIRMFYIRSANNVQHLLKKGGLYSPVYGEIIENVINLVKVVDKDTLEDDETLVKVHKFCELAQYLKANKIIKLKYVNNIENKYVSRRTKKNCI